MQARTRRRVAAIAGKTFVVACALVASGPAIGETGDKKLETAPVGVVAAAPAVQTAAGETHDIKLHQLHVKSVEQQVQSAAALAAALNEQAAARQLDVEAFVSDARLLADAEPPVTAEQAAKREDAHRETLSRVEAALGLPGLFGTLRRGDTPIEPGPPAVPAPAGGCNCSKLEFPPPYPGSFHRTYPLGGIAVSPAPVRELTAELRAGVAAAGHQVAGTGESFAAPAGIRSVVASATMDLFADVGVGGLGVAHGWSDVQLVVTDRATGTEACRTRFETNNRATGAWYYRDIRDHGERTLSCSFVRDPAVAASYAVDVELRAYGTFGGLVGGHSTVRARFRRIEVALCP